jgi:hypothetical protein
VSPVHPRSSLLGGAASRFRATDGGNGLELSVGELMPRDVVLPVRVCQRQRGALREAGRDPGAGDVRRPEVVERYEQ